jgi:D-alanyl-D-alanine carboxypeptidase (penicillin-binding protein 5/6)
MKRIVSFVLVIALVAVLLPVGASAAGPEVAAKSAVLMDMTTGQVLYEHNAHEMLPPASVTKVMTLLLIMEAIDSGRIGWDDTVTASESAAAKGGSQVYLKVGETMTVTDMVKSIAVSSANDCACAMAEHISGSEGAFVEAMNEKAKALGMEHTHFLNCTGLDDDPQASNHLTCAMDIAIMSRALMMEHPDIRKFTTIWMDTIRNGSFGLSNTNKLVRFYPGATGLKTGFTQKAGYCLSATARRDGMELVATVMGSESSKDRFNACKQLLDYGFANYALVTPQTEEGQVPVKLGTADTVKVMPKEKIQLLVDKAQRNQVNITTQLPDSIDAPVSKGQKIGTVTVRVGDQVVSEVPLLAQEAVPKLSWWQMFLRILRRICMAK